MGKVGGIRSPNDDRTESTLTHGDGGLNPLPPTTRAECTQTNGGGGGCRGAGGWSGCWLDSLSAVAGSASHVVVYFFGLIEFGFDRFFREMAVRDGWVGHRIRPNYDDDVSTHFEGV